MNSDLTSLIEKYNKPGPRYTSYPPATFFAGNYSVDEFYQQLNASNKQKPENISLYFHVPFCPQLCYFCGCNTDKMRKMDVVDRYFKAMSRELELISGKLDKTRKISQIHWGGGTPNSVSLKFIREIMDQVSANFNFTEQPEIAMECNPAYLSFKQVDTLAELGFNRLSIGIQDFSNRVLLSINRKPSLININELTSYISGKNIKINFDFVYGLPLQTPQSFAKSIEKAVALNPDRIVTFSYAHVPWVKTAQKELEKFQLPSASEKLEMFIKAQEIIEKAGYCAIGMDHFAKPTDDLYIAFKNQKLHRNFMGYCSENTTGQVYAFGSTAITQLEGSYWQNIKDTDTYIESTLSGKPAQEKGYILNFENVVCREIIEEIMCNQYVSLISIANKYQISVDELFRISGFKTDLLETFIADNLLIYNNYEIKIINNGRYVLRNIAMLFDPLLSKKEGVYSKTI
jgi:oxygen-independent coproporphyrinogen III oxidase